MFCGGHGVTSFHKTRSWPLNSLTIAMLRASFLLRKVQHSYGYVALARSFCRYQDAATSTSSMKKAVVTLKLLTVWALKTSVTVLPA